MTPHSRSRSAFSILLTAVTVSLLGAITAPLLQIQYAPTEQVGTMHISFSYPGASARVVEADVTSVLEGSLNTLPDVSSISSISRKGSGDIALQFKRGTRLDMARLEAASQLRSMYEKLPAGVSYPLLNSAFTGNKESVLITCVLYGTRSPEEMARWAGHHLADSLARVDGIGAVRLSGAGETEWLVEFQPERLEMAGLSPEQLCNAIREACADVPAGRLELESGYLSVRLRSQVTADHLEQVVVGHSDGRIFRIGDVATVSRRTTLPEHLVRFNGLPTIEADIMAGENVNILSVSRRANLILDDISRHLPPDMVLRKTFDAAGDLRRELRRIAWQGSLCLLVLMLFVTAVSRSLRYVFIIASGIVFTLCTSVIVYHFCGMTLHVYSLTGITISLGFVIDTALVVTDHYTYHRNMHMAGAVSGALLTTVFALAILYRFTSSQQQQMGQFIGVIVINLCVALAVSLATIPALVEKCPVRLRGMACSSFKRRRRLVACSARYSRLIVMFQRHRTVWCCVMILGFGLPLHLLPSSLKASADTRNRFCTALQHAGCNLYNSTIGSTWYQIHRHYFENALGGAYHYFAAHSAVDIFSRDESEAARELVIEASLPDGHSLGQMDMTLKDMENFISQFSEVAQFRTECASAADGTIRVSFRTDADDAFARSFKQQVWAEACRFGGATWTVYGIDNQVLTNRVRLGRVPYGIYLYGYNYDMLYRWGHEITDALNNHLRISEAAIMNSPERQAADELFLSFRQDRMMLRGITSRDYYDYLHHAVFRQHVGMVPHNGRSQPVVVESAGLDRLDAWRLHHEMPEIQGRTTPLSAVGTLQKRSSGNEIVRRNQAYELFIGYHFIGPDDWAAQVSADFIEELNQDLLPVGYHAESLQSRAGSRRIRHQGGMIVLVVLVIAMTTAILFESLTLPGVMLLLLPVSYSGMFFIFGLTRTTFGQGGLAAMVTLSGIAVNAGIYLLHEYNTLSRRSRQAPLRIYVKAFNRKIIPTLLTICSTVIGLVPFFFGRAGHDFWFAFAIGVSGGMLCSVVALVIYLPAFMPFKRKARQ